MSGRVFLVGAGPGDPGLLTQRAAELLAGANVVVVGSDVPGSIAERSRGLLLPAEPTAEAVARQLIDLAARHARVVRLYGGDPFILGGGGEEARILAEAGIPFEVVPGIPVSFGAAVYSGIPLTGAPDRFGVVLANPGFSGHWPAEAQGLALAEGRTTLVMQIPREELGQLQSWLIACGIPQHLPIALIEDGTLPSQRTILSSAARLVEAGGALEEREVVVIVGEAARLHEELAWAERRPLSGRTIVVTRPQGQAEAFADALRRLGARVLETPTIRIENPTDPGPLRRAVEEPGRFDWIVFTSANGVASFWAALRAAGKDSRDLSGVSICAIGPATATAVKGEGVRADLIPEQYVAEAVVEALHAVTDLAGRRILLPRAEVARDVLPRALAALGADVFDVPAYRTVQEPAARGRLVAELEGGRIDMVTFTSSSAVRNFVGLVGTISGSVGVASIGPMTSATARELGLEVDVEANPHTSSALAEAISRFFTGRGGRS